MDHHPLDATGVGDRRMRDPFYPFGPPPGGAPPAPPSAPPPASPPGSPPSGGPPAGSKPPSAPPPAAPPPSQPPMQPPPAAPGSMDQVMEAPSQFAPPPAKKSAGAGKIILIGCGIIFALGLLIVVALGVVGYVMKDQITQAGQEFKQEIDQQASAMNNQMDASLEEAIPQFMNLLSKGHTQAKRDTFEKYLRKTMIDSRKQLGVTTWTPVYTELMASLSQAASDGRITTKESKAWEKEVDKKLAAAGYTE